MPASLMGTLITLNAQAAELGVSAGDTAQVDPAPILLGLQWFQLARNVIDIPLAVVTYD